jgi:hypothetical protein
MEPSRTANRVASRIEVESRDFRNADATTRNLRYGRVLGLLDAGTILGFLVAKGGLAHRRRGLLRRHPTDAPSDAQARL